MQDKNAAIVKEAHLRHKTMIYLGGGGGGGKGFFAWADVNVLCDNSTVY